LEAPVFKGVAFAGCQSCHKDPHHGAFQEAKFRGSCESCHNTGGWKRLKGGAGFDHGGTKFPLTGKHAEVGCAKCHKDSNFQRPIAHEKCGSCHADPHGKQFAATDCKACHTDRSFKPSLFDNAAHQKSAFPLEEKHATVACGKCHAPAGRGAVYKTGKTKCAECHEDAHGGEFSGTGCQTCHTQRSFKPSSFDLTRHGKTKFGLSGKHAAVACGDCHKQVGTRRQYHFASQTCASCHADPHRTKVACESCHTAEDWKKATPFDHASTKFLLDGKHAGAGCAQCHKPVDAKFAKAPGFANTAAACGACHQKDEVHGGQFSRPERVEECSDCHGAAQWKVAEFDHDRTRFALDRAHRNVSCEKCHKTNEQKIRMYRDTTSECVKCH
jgi:hypothetical protein